MRSLKNGDTFVIPHREEEEIYRHHPSGGVLLFGPKFRASLFVRNPLKNEISL
jgi:hypothetical protein